MATSKILPIYVSDHKPILLDIFLERNIVPIPFRFIPLWISQEGFQELIFAAWSRQFQGSSFYVWERKLRGLKRALKSWAKSIKSPTLKRKDTQEALELLQLALEDTIVTQELWNQEVDLQNSLHQPCNEEEEYWRQNSIILWLLAGDKNMSFFHKQAETHKHFKAVNENQYQGQETKEFEGIKKVSHYFFKDLYTVLDEVPIDSYSYPLSQVP